MKPNKENIVNEMLIELESGISYAGCLKVNGSKWKLSESTFVRYWNTANEKYKAIQNKKNEVLVELSIKKDVERLNKAILNKDEALEVLTKIATDPIKETPTGIASAKTEQISAIKAIADLLGWEAPKKSEIEVTDKTPIDLTNLTDEHLRTLAKIKSESGVS